VKYITRETKNTMSSDSILFAKQKAQCMESNDLSRKGSVDQPIEFLVSFLNEQPAYFTTSSCSGRIIIFEETPGCQKQGCKWLFTTHEMAMARDVANAVKQSTGNAFFKFEPFILHTQCRTLHDAQSMHSVAVASGFRNSGLTVSKKGKIMTAVRSTQSLEVPLTKAGEILVSNKYMEYIVELANERMQENFFRITRFSMNIRDCLTAPPSMITNKASKKNRHLSQPKHDHTSAHSKDQSHAECATNGRTNDSRDTDKCKNNSSEEDLHHSLDIDSELASEMDAMFCEVPNTEDMPVLGQV